MIRIRPPVAAGSFYPEHPAALAASVDSLLAEAGHTLPGGVRALVAPHAGYRYSGAVAAAAFASVPEQQARRVALLGPSHFAPLSGCAVCAADAWRTPLGVVPVDEELRRTALALGATADDRPHVADHALEVHLPFLQRRVGTRLAVLPVAVGADADAAALVAGLASMALVVVSTDLSHFLDDDTARRVDRRTADAVIARDPRALDLSAACGIGALRALVECARDADWHCTLLDLRTSADTTGDRSRVVGYGAFAFA